MLRTRKRKKKLRLFFHFCLPFLPVLGAIIFLTADKDALVFISSAGSEHRRAVETDAAFSENTHSAEIYRVNRQGVKTSDDADISRMIVAEVVNHVDGDTVRVRIQTPPAGLNEKETIRMLGVDTPETVHPSRPVEYFGKEASEFTRRALLGKQVYLAFDWDTRDQYGRLLAYVYTDKEQCFNTRLIREGYAHVYTRFPFQFMDEFRRFEQEARKAKLGLWAKREYRNSK